MTRVGVGSRNRVRCRCIQNLRAELVEGLSSHVHPWTWGLGSTVTGAGPGTRSRTGRGPGTSPARRNGHPRFQFRGEPA